MSSVLIVLLVLLISAVFSAGVWLVLMMRRDEPLLGAYGMFAAMPAGMIAIVYGALASM